MNICVICPEIGNNHGSAFIGGHTNNVVQSCKELSKKGHEITIITTPHRYPSENIGENILNDYADIITLPISASYLSINYGVKFAFRTFQTAKQLKKGKKFDIVHGHSGYSMPATITSISSRIMDAPSVHSIYCPIEPLVNNLNFVRIFSNHSFSKFYFNGISKIIAVSNNVKRTLIESGIQEERIEFIPPGINTNIFNPSVSCEGIRKKYGIEDNELLMVFVGNLSRIKGLHLLIEALNIVKADIPKFKVLMVLNIPLETYLNPKSSDIDLELISKVKEKIKRYRLNDHIIPLGLLNNIEEVVAASDLFLMPFLNTVGVADYPLSLLEAMAVSTVPICTKVGGIPEIIENNKNGILIEPDSVEELVNSILYCNNNREKLKEMGINSSKLVIDNLSLKSTTDNLESIYNNLTRD